MALSNFFWNTASPNPADSLLISDIPAAIRYVKLNSKTAIQREHAALGDAADTGGEHLNGSAVAYQGTATPVNRPDANGDTTALASNDIDKGRFWLDDNFDPPALKRWDGSAFEPASGSLTGSSPLQVLQNTTHEDTDGGRESALSFKGEQSGGEATTLAKIECSHEGSSDDEKGQMRFLLNDGDDTNTPSKEALRFQSTGLIDVANSLSVLDEDAMGSDDAEALATQQSIKAHDAFGEFTDEDDDTNSLLVAHAYLANQDGFVTVIYTSGTAGQTMTGYVDTDTDPPTGGTVLAAVNSRTTGAIESRMFTVANGKYFEIVLTGGSAVIYWQPKSGTLIKCTDQEP